MEQLGDNCRAALGINHTSQHILPQKPVSHVLSLLVPRKCSDSLQRNKPSTGSIWFICQRESDCTKLIFQWWLLLLIIHKHIPISLHTDKLQQQFPDELFELLGIFSTNKLAVTGYLQRAVNIIKEYYVIECRNYTFLNTWERTEKAEKIAKSSLYNKAAKILDCFNVPEHDGQPPCPKVMIMLLSCS